MNNFSVNLDKNNANYIPLTPLTFIERTKDVYPDYESIVYGKRNYTWLETYKRYIKFAFIYDYFSKINFLYCYFFFNIPYLYLSF